jgi:hypothetical protein
MADIKLALLLRRVTKELVEQNAVIFCSSALHHPIRPRISAISVPSSYGQRLLKPTIVA